MDLCRTLLKDVVLPKIKSVYVIDYYEGVRGLLASRPDFPYPDIFANPRLRTKTEVLWSTEAFIHTPKRLSDLEGYERDYYSKLLYNEIRALERLIEKLREEEGGEPLSELLSKTIMNIDERSVFCGDQKIVIVNWGLIPRQPEIGSSGIYRSGKFLASWNDITSSEQLFKKLEPEEKVDKTEDLTETEKIETDQTSLDEKGEEETYTFEAVEESSRNKDVKGENVSNFDVKEEEQHEEKDLPEEKTNNSTQEEKVKDSFEDKSENKDVVSEKEEGKPENSSVLKSEDKKEDKIEDKTSSHGGKKAGDESWNSFFHGFGNGLWFLFKRLWWLLLFILIVILGLFVFRGYQGPLNQYNPFYNPLPSKPVIMPVEKGKVGMSEDGLFEVATDRLNIMLEKKDENTMLDWAKAFKKAYPSADYEIKYYNKDSYILQIKVPENERINVLKELNSKLPGFGFDVFEESVYSSDFVSNDPALGDPKASWYIDVIGAREAWDVTKGDDRVIVAVVDNGFDLSHPEFAGKIVKPYNVLTETADLWPIMTKHGINGHGTHVAATAVGNCDNGEGLLGIAPNCSLMPVQVGNDNPTGSMSNTAILEGVLYAINNGADIVNVSLGKNTPPDVKNMSEGEQLNYIANSFRQEEAMWNRVFDRARENNCIIVFAAGNDNVISGIDPKKRNLNTLRVSALAPDITKAYFSNFGRYPDIRKDYSTVSAPGVDIYSAVPNGEYDYMQGTSMSAPIVSGTLALMKSVNGSLSAEEAIAILQETGKEVHPSIGPMISITNAIKAAGGEQPVIDCEKVKLEIQRLENRLDSLKRLCPGETAPSDTLKYNDVVKDPRSLDGTWKSTTELYSTLDHSPIELYLKFKDLKGQLIIVNKKFRFTAPLTATITEKGIYIEQHEPATCPDTDDTFVPYIYECSEDRKGNLFCNATSATNKVSFNLVRIK